MNPSCKYQKEIQILVSAVALIGMAGLGVGIRNGFTAPARVTVLKTPYGGLQPQAVVDFTGTLHLLFFKGDPGAGDIFYVRRKPGEKGFSDPLRVNSQPGSAVALGTIRGPQIALGKNHRVYVAWNGSDKAWPRAPHPSSQTQSSPYSDAPMLYTRLNDQGTAFEPQRNLMRSTFGLDGGGTITADTSGKVYVAWHASALSDPPGEDYRRVWVAYSRDEGKTFSREISAFSDPLGACACCGMRALVDQRGTLYILYRSAREKIHRDAYLLVSQDQGRSFRRFRLHPWKVNACPMSSFALAEGSTGILAAWETKGQVYFARIHPKTLEISPPVSAPGPGGNRKHPALAVNSQGEMILVWTEGTGWGRGGDLVWQVFDRLGQATNQKGRLSNAIPAWSFATVVAQRDGGFIIIY